MATNDRSADEGPERAAKPRSSVFAIRLRTEEVAGGREYRGTAREVVGGAFRYFRDWSDLTAFMIAHMEDDQRARAWNLEGGSAWPLHEQP